jgi:3-oxoacyl-[acyl-carrier protein] reductase
MTSENGQAGAVLVTGAAGGIGRACVLHLLARGRKVLATDLGQDLLAAAFPERREDLALIACDVTDPADCAAATAEAERRFGGLDALMHWGGRHSTKTWDELTAEDFDRLLRINVTGSFLIAQAAALRMKARGKGGAIVLTGSTAVIHAPIGGAAGNGGPAYVTSKAAITGLVRTLARALGPYGIRVNGIAPGVTDTPMIGNYSQTTRDLQIANSPMGRIGSAEEVAEAGCLLIEDGARYVSGEILIVNGATAFG